MTTQQRYNLVKRYAAKVVLDLIALVFAWVTSFLLVFSGRETLDIIVSLGWLNLVFILAPLCCFLLFRLHSTIWRYSGLPDSLQIIKATSIGIVITIAIILLASSHRVPNQVFFFNWMMVIFFTGGIRVAVRQIHEIYFRSKDKSKDVTRQRALIYGAGRAGEILLRNFSNTPNTGIDVVGLLDDDPLKKGQSVHNKRVLGDGRDIATLVRQYNISEIYFAIASLSGAEARRILHLIKEQVGHEVEVKTIPGLRDVVEGRVSMNQLRKIEIKDLLRRKPVQLNFTPVREMIQDARVLVVGGGGSIGSELCRQIANFNPEQLMVMDLSEYNLYILEQQITADYPKLNSVFLAGSACNESFVRNTFETYRPDIVFHAAAYKHVPMMEINPWSAIYNNLQSMLTLSAASDEFGVERFVLISTDKAVRPTNVMGATKRICELISLVYGQSSETHFMAVRFGNVLGSSGSVIPKFKEQIANGGPVTVTHPDITRYFMLIPEAVELVMQAGAIGKTGDVYVLDMGSPIRIVDLAKYMIELSGLKVNEDIKIEFSGLRPGEKMHESLYLEGEETDTNIPGLYMLHPKDVPNSAFLEKVEELIYECENLNHNQLREAIRELVPEYTPYSVKSSEGTQSFVPPEKTIISSEGVLAESLG